MNDDSDSLARLVVRQNAELARLHGIIDQMEQKLECQRQRESDFRKAEAERDALRVLFAIRKEHDDRSILDDMVIIANLLERQCGEIGLALSRRMLDFVIKVKAALRGAGPDALEDATGQGRR